MKSISVLILFPLINVQWFLTTRSMLEIFQRGRLSWPLPPTRLSLSWRSEYASYESLPGRWKYYTAKWGILLRGKPGRYHTSVFTMSVSHVCHYIVSCFLLPHSPMFFTPLSLCVSLAVVPIHLCTWNPRCVIPCQYQYFLPFAVFLLLTGMASWSSSLTTANEKHILWRQTLTLLAM